MPVFSNKSLNLTREDSYWSRTVGHEERSDSIAYANCVANNRVACQLEAMNEGNSVSAAKLTELISEVTELNTQVARLANTFDNFNENFSFLRKVVEQTWEGYHEKGWFAELMRKIAER